MTFSPLEGLVRPFLSVISGSEPRARSVPDEVHPVAYIAWGEDSSFNVEDFRTRAGRLTGPYADNNDDNDDDEKDRERFKYTEEGRSSKFYRVENENDTDSYAIVESVARVAFSGPDGAQYIFRMNPSQPGRIAGSGQTPPAPPDLDHIGKPKRDFQDVLEDFLDG